MYGNQQDRNDYNISSSQTTQANFETIASTLEAQLAARDKDVKTAMAGYQADGVSDRYAAMEAKWNACGDEVKMIINTVRSSLAENDDIALRAMSRAGASIPI